MCGITGIFYMDGSLVDLARLRRMTETLAHRGPDANGFYTDGAVGLGHQRLKIIDLEGGKQPLFNENKSQVIVFNGEIYNFLELREALIRKGHRFQTRSDTEVILHAYDEFGEECVRHLRGMFAFAIWNHEKKELFLARDRVGIKPLYYYWDGKKFLFASEIKAILQDPAVDRKIDASALDDYLTYLYIPGPKTVFRSIRKLRPAHTLTVSARGLEEHEYWDLVFKPTDGLRQGDYTAGLLQKLNESVALHLVSEVPLGAFLSGGVDSSAVVGLMSAQMNRPVETASIGFRESGFNELPYARAVAQRFNARAYERIVDPSAAAILDRLVWHFDEPFGDSSMVPTYYLSEAARERVTVCLSGDGGDENFAGYRRYRFDLLENRIRSVIPAGLRSPLFGTLGRLYPKADWLPQIFRAKTLLTNLSLSPEKAYFHSVSWFGPEMKRVLYPDSLKQELSGYDAFSVMKGHFDRTEGWDPLSRIQYVDIKTYLVDDILTKVDRASMAHSLEVRVPLLDHEVMQYAATIPARHKLQNGEGKFIFKKALNELLPPEVLNRSKMGFSIPLSKWFRTDLKGLFEDRVLTNGSFVGNFFDSNAIRQYWNCHQRRTRDYSPHLWALLVLESWGRRFLG
ncbi:MAG: asparagine synthase (glutamine-hydrolyzing) [Deltaproteobacteria bacterium]|nr:asparagine synthase (glutamine-hydrolyzing) [Deltaproteobacteria bacterium]